MTAYFKTLGTFRFVLSSPKASISTLIVMPAIASVLGHHSIAEVQVDSRDVEEEDHVV
jgi:hypothetical protein